MIIKQSMCIASTYLVDLGGGWGTVYHDDLRYIEDPKSLAELEGEDARWQPWRPVLDAAEVQAVTARLEESVGRIALARRAPSGLETVLL